jgi:hypothetical protein
MKQIWKTFVIVVLCASCCEIARAQVPPATILQIDTDNNVRYIYDTPDFAAFANVQTAINQTFPTFATWMNVADIVAVNGKPAKGVFLSRQVAINLDSRHFAARRHSYWFNHAEWTRRQCSPTGSACRVKAR